MLQLAIGGHEQFRVSTMELERGGVSYTVETLRELHAARPDDELFLLIGADSLHDLPTWKEPAEVCTLALPLVVSRAGHAEPAWDVLQPLLSAARVQEIRRNEVKMPQIGIKFA